MTYKLYPLASNLHDPEALWLSYDWNDSFDNREWRPCVEHFVHEIAKLGHEVIPLSSPPFTPGEDFVEIEYSVGGVRTRFSSDLLLSLIVIDADDPSVLRGAWESIGARVGWESESTSSEKSQPGLWTKLRSWLR